jgi:tetraacyldisaccharide 4'-kinase
MSKRLRRWLEDSWYQDLYVSSAFMPLSMLYDDAMRFRRFCYRKNLLRKTRLPVPVIVVGNLTVGGTGKTPLVVFLAELLQKQGYQPGIITRGYGGNSQHWPQVVTADSSTNQVGDEAVLLAIRSGCPVVAGPERGVDGQRLIDQFGCDVILCDDGLQHYALERDIEIVVIDGERRFGNGYTLPCGPLREPANRINSVDFVVVNGETTQEHEFYMAVDGNAAVNLVTREEKKLHDFQTECHALAGIGNPKRFFDLLKREKLNIKEQAFPDHYRYRAKDIQFKDTLPVLMTEKDAVKCKDFADERHWFVPVKAFVQQQFTDQLLNQLKEKQRG